MLSTLLPVEARPLQQMTDSDIEKRKKFVAFQGNDVARIATVRDAGLERAPVLAASFYDYLANFEETEVLFRRTDLLDEAKRLKEAHIRAMVSGEYGSAYVEQCTRLAEIYSQCGIEIRVLLGAFSHLIREFSLVVSERYNHDQAQAFETVLSLEKLCYFDLGVLSDLLIDGRERVIETQQKVLLELSTPVLQLRDRLLILPIIGVIDTQRAKQLTSTLLNAIRTNRAKIVVIDITGVAAVDSKVANHLMQTVTAARLMGTKVIVTGLSADVAQSLVGLGVDLSVLNTIGDLQGGLEEAERLLTSA